jgi:AcrR family transcriptional regulator/DNA-binding MarR family transcriptional regulator
MLAARPRRSERPDRRGDAGHGQVAEIQRARMLTAMVQEVSERGVANVSVGHVVGRSGVSRRTFYEIFEDREDCFLAAFDEALRHAEAVVVPAYGTGGAWRTRIRAGLTALLGFLQDDRAAARLLVVESLAAGPRALQCRRQVFGSLVSVLELGRTESKASLDPPALAAEAIVGGLLSVIHARLVASNPEHRDRVRGAPAGGSLLELLGPLMGMIVLPYLGPVAARKEIERPTPERAVSQPLIRSDPLQDLPMRFTYRTMRVLVSVAEHPGSSNRTIGESAGIADQGQASKLLARLHKLGLIENKGGDPARGEPNAWTLTNTGQQVQESIAGLGAGAS